MNDRMTSEAEKLHGSDAALLREPQIVKPDTPTSSAGVHAPRVTPQAIHAQLAIIDQELEQVRALVVDGATSRDLEQAANRIERVQRLAGQAARFARTLATRAHVALR